jgi:hypothetical protein
LGSPFKDQIVYTRFHGSRWRNGSLHGFGRRKFISPRQDRFARAVDALQEAPERGWLVVDMKRDWKTVFRPE